MHLLPVTPLHPRIRPKKTCCLMPLQIFCRHTVLQFIYLHTVAVLIYVRTIFNSSVYMQQILCVFQISLHNIFRLDPATLRCSLAKTMSTYVKINNKTDILKHYIGIKISGFSEIKLIYMNAECDMPQYYSIRRSQLFLVYPHPHGIGINKEASWVWLHRKK
jgi:hypothetical protein